MGFFDELKRSQSDSNLASLTQLTEQLEAELDAEFDALKGPITHDIIQDPITMPDGHTYERKSVLQIIERQRMFVSSLTNEHYPIVNKEAAEKWIQCVVYKERRDAWLKRKGTTLAAYFADVNREAEELETDMRAAGYSCGDEYVVYEVSLSENDYQHLLQEKARNIVGIPKDGEEECLAAILCPKMTFLGMMVGIFCSPIIAFGYFSGLYCSSPEDKEILIKMAQCAVGGGGLLLLHSAHTNHLQRPLKCNLNGSQFRTMFSINNNEWTQNSSQDNTLTRTVYAIGWKSQREHLFNHGFNIDNNDNNFCPLFFNVECARRLCTELNYRLFLNNHLINSERTPLLAEQPRPQQSLYFVRP